MPAPHPVRPLHPVRRAARPEPVTDPIGFPAVEKIAPPALPVQSHGPDVRTAPDDAPSIHGRTVDLAEVRALAAAFAADYLSWDEDDPIRRGDVLAEHLPARLRDLTRGTPGPGWAGEGRQRAEISLAGAIGSDEDGRLLVDVRVRVTPYFRAGRAAASGLPVDVVRRGPELGRPSSAPPPDGKGWTGRRASWVRISVPVTHDGDRLVAEPDEELLAPTGDPDPACRVGGGDGCAAVDGAPVARGSGRPTPACR
ncbi:hypothetical protein [Pseudonocardia sp. SCN 73-27]|uniref:hypothetical protein n=1 Tax=Pseudonocardia sp. SCN 73-27 TaxID=1660132 RepID=UPI000A90358D|nr:hypothetical protein [Pseudonocardia sp. SCN 73-27]